jgi:hypothetical protein
VFGLLKMRIREEEKHFGQLAFSKKARKIPVAFYQSSKYALVN